MKKVVKAKNIAVNHVSVKSANATPGSVKLTINGNEVPLDHVMSIQVIMQPDQLNTAIVQLIVDELDLEATDMKELPDDDSPKTSPKPPANPTPRK